MTRVDQIIADALAGSPETHVAILAREVVRLREVGAVVVPDDDRPSREFLENYVEGFDPGERSAALFGWREGRRHLRENSRAIPAGRVLGDGMVAVDRRIIEKFTTGCHEWMPGLGRCGDQYPGGERQLCSKCAPLRAALRTNHEGADHD